MLCFLYNFTVSYFVYSIDATVESDHFGRLINHFMKEGNFRAAVHLVNEKTHIVFFAK